MDLLFFFCLFGLFSHTFTVSFLLYIHSLSFLLSFWLFICLGFRSFLTESLWSLPPLDILPPGFSGCSLLKTSHRLFSVIVFLPLRMGYFFLSVLCSFSYVDPGWCLLICPLFCLLLILSLGHILLSYVLRIFGCLFFSSLSLPDFSLLKASFLSLSLSLH